MDSTDIASGLADGSITDNGDGTYTDATTGQLYYINSDGSVGTAAAGTYAPGVIPSTTAPTTGIDSFGNYTYSVGTDPQGNTVWESIGADGQPYETHLDANGNIVSITDLSGNALSTSSIATGTATPTGAAGSTAGGSSGASGGGSSSGNSSATTAAINALQKLLSQAIASNQAPSTISAYQAALLRAQAAAASSTSSSSSTLLLVGLAAVLFLAIGKN